MSDFIVNNARSVINASRSQLQSDVLKFPLDIEKVPHRILFRFISRGSNANQGGRSDAPPTNASRTSGAILLPVPTEMIDGVTMSYSTTNLGITGEMIAGAAHTLANMANGIDTKVFESGQRTGQNLSNFIGSTVNSVTGAVSQIYNSSPYRGDTAQAMAQYFGGALINEGLSRLGVSKPEAVSALAVGLGRTLNPFTTAVFQGVNLRRFRFAWRFSPVSEKESKELEKIMKKLRVKSLPKISNSGLFMKFPDEVEFDFQGMQENYFTFPTAPCFIETVTFNKAPSSTPVFFAGTGAPAFVEINMSLIEVRPLVVDSNDNIITNPTQLRTSTTSTSRFAENTNRSVGQALDAEANWSPSR